jgi:hypothetical protein
MTSCTTSAYFGSPRGLVSCCKTYSCSSDKGEVGGSSPPRPTISSKFMLRFPSGSGCSQAAVDAGKRNPGRPDDAGARVRGSEAAETGYAARSLEPKNFFDRAISGEKANAGSRGRRKSGRRKRSGSRGKRRQSSEQYRNREKRGNEREKERARRICKALQAGELPLSTSMH